MAVNFTLSFRLNSLGSLQPLWLNFSNVRFSAPKMNLLPSLIHCELCGSISMFSGSVMQVVQRSDRLQNGNLRLIGGGTKVTCLDWKVGLKSRMFTLPLDRLGRSVLACTILHVLCEFPEWGH